MDADSFTDRFFEIEERLDLFADRSAGFLWWDAVRYDVYRLVFGRIADFVTPKPQRLPWLTRLRGWIERVMLRVRLRIRTALRNYDVIIFRAPRQIRSASRLLDPAIDHLIALCPGRHLVIETAPHYYHIGKQRTAGRAFEFPVILTRLVETIEAEFKSGIDETQLREFVVARLGAFVHIKQTYLELFTRVRPRLVLLTQNGVEKALFSAAHELGCVVVEGQHGLIGYAHPAYSYPRTVDAQGLGGFPDLFLTFSDHWNKVCHYPASECVAVGNDAFHLGISLPLPAGTGKVMFVSGDAYHRTLVEWMRPLAAELPERHFIYKLHPNQERSRDAICSELKAISNVEVIGSEVPASNLLAEVTHVVVIVSTVSLEALQAGRNVCVLPVMNYRVHPDLFDWEGVAVTHTAEELRRAVQRMPKPRDPPRFFDPFDSAKAKRLLEQRFYGTPS